MATQAHHQRRQRPLLRQRACAIPVLAERKLRSLPASTASVPRDCWRGPRAAAQRAAARGCVLMSRRLARMWEAGAQVSRASIPEMMITGTLLRASVMIAQHHTCQLLEQLANSSQSGNSGNGIISKAEFTVRLSGSSIRNRSACICEWQIHATAPSPQITPSFLIPTCSYVSASQFHRMHGIAPALGMRFCVIGAATLAAATLSVQARILPDCKASRSPHHGAIPYFHDAY